MRVGKASAVAPGSAQWGLLLVPEAAGGKGLAPDVQLIVEHLLGKIEQVDGALGPAFDDGQTGGDNIAIGGKRFSNDLTFDEFGLRFVDQILDKYAAVHSVDAFAIAGERLDFDRQCLAALELGGHALVEGFGSAGEVDLICGHGFSLYKMVDTTSESWQKLPGNKGNAKGVRQKELGKRS
jgi:hypothetical protein